MSGWCIAGYVNINSGNGITDEGVKYILPLIIGESYPEYRDGLPVHISLK